MSIFDFINSPDIREHWEKIGYKPSPLEMAWLIWQSNNHTLLQKHSAFWTLIDNTDDCPIPAGLHGKVQESLHEFLILRQQLEIHLSSDFYKEEPGAVYSYRMYLEDDGDREWHSSGPLFCSFEEAYEHAQSEKIPLSPNFVEFVKTYIGKEEKQIFLRLNREKKSVYLDENHYLSEEEHEIYHGVFEGMWFDFPTPFEKGDILKQADCLYRHPYEPPFVMTSICTERADHFAKNGDGSDMTAHGYFLERDGHIYLECVHDYMNLERVPTELARRERMLVPISRYLKGEIDLALLLGAHKIMCYEQLIAETKGMLNYTAEGFELAGIEKKKTKI